MKVLAKLAVGVSSSLLLLGVAVADTSSHHGMTGQDKGAHCDHKGMHANSKEMVRAEKRLGELKAKLKLTAEQEPAWQAFADKMNAQGKNMGASREKMWQEMPGTSPERMARAAEAMKERAQTMAEMADAVKAFYDVLTPAQKATFDKKHSHYQK